VARSPCMDARVRKAPEAKGSHSRAASLGAIKRFAETYGARRTTGGKNGDERKRECSDDNNGV
jgi:hypothetical protein